ncbi:nicotinate-nucleotide--dimethylbenzimidazole phosphoribosyltransferase [Corynebacterium sp. YSMAA1_1_F7]|uniref:nicotinate-nucleotide--dimethylbenzimidazole phosphoribosyltransferase n=1 Tax=Corynebacterium sp. YSMAA1_1_F7 TaxID=3383590 RepID=UPI0038D1695C
MASSTSTPTFPSIVPPDEATRSRAEQLRTTAPTSAGIPAGSLGRLEDVATWIASCQGSAPATPLDAAGLILVTGEHGVAEAHPEISALPTDFNAQVLQALADATAPVVDACRAARVSLSIIDATLGKPSGPIDTADALSPEDYEKHLARGMRFADQEADKGTSVLLLGDLGRGLTTVAAAVIGSVCSVEPVKIIGRGSGIDDEAWKTKVAVIRDAMFRARDDKAVAERVLQQIGSADLVVMAGILAQSAVRRTPVIFDGVGAIAAALCAQMLAPGAAAWWLAASAGTEPAALPALNALGLEPLLDVRLGAGQGLGAVLALPMVRYAVAACSTSV